LKTSESETKLEGLGNRLLTVIHHLHITQSECARRLKSSPGFISDVVRGKKNPGADFLFGLREAFGVSIDWLLSGDGVMFGGHGIDLELLRSIRLKVAVARAAIADNNPTANTLLCLIRDGQLSEATGDPEIVSFLDQTTDRVDDFELVTELYNGHIQTADPVLQHQNLLAAAVTHFQAHKSIDKIAALAWLTLHS